MRGLRRGQAGGAQEEQPTQLRPAAGEPHRQEPAGVDARGLVLLGERRAGASGEWRRVGECVGMERSWHSSDLAPGKPVAASLMQPPSG